MDCKICAKWGEILKIIDNFKKKVYSNSAFFLIYNAGFITEQQLIEALEMQLGVEFVDLTAVSIRAALDERSILNRTSARASAARSRRDASQERSAGRTLRCIRPN